MPASYPIEELTGNCLEAARGAVAKIRKSTTFPFAMAGGLLRRINVLS
jgi:hypothetical protein